MSQDNKTHHLPAPLVPAYVKLHGICDLPFSGDYIFGTKAYCDNTPENRNGAACLMKLIAHSWATQVPAASLPDDDEQLMALSHFAATLEEWKAMRPVVLDGWVKCSDGRLYNPYYAALALKAWEHRDELPEAFFEVFCSEEGDEA